MQTSIMSTRLRSETSLCKHHDRKPSLRAGSIRPALPSRSRIYCDGSTEQVVEGPAFTRRALMKSAVLGTVVGVAAPLG
eukprot:1402610-Pyramimonas_sp.AAC.1